MKRCGGGVDSDTLPIRTPSAQVALADNEEPRESAATGSDPRGSQSVQFRPSTFEGAM